MQHLLFRLYGPMAAWGEVAVGEDRPSAAYPSKSAVLGLVAGALGISRKEDAKHQALEAALGFAVKVDREGDYLCDYHTVQVPTQRKGQVLATRRQELAEPKLKTILSKREYRCDALAIVCLWLRGPAEIDLQEILAALRAPKFTPFLGRKACPLALPMQPQVVEAPTLSAAFSETTFPKVDRLTYDETQIYWEEHPAPGLTRHARTRRKDRLLSRERWQFADRTEYVARQEPSA